MCPISRHSAHSDLPDFIDSSRITAALQSAHAASADTARITDILVKAESRAGLSMEEAAILLRAEGAETHQAILDAASRLKKAVYGNRLVLFAPLYVTNECRNRCLYCGFQDENTTLDRRTLTREQLEREVRILEAQGQKRLLLVYGEHPTLGAEWIAETMRTVYATNSGHHAEIRRVNVNCAPLSVDDFRILKSEGIGTYQCFQETYHQPTYAAMHLRGPKTSYLWRLYALHRAMEAGIDDVGMGPLLGLYSPDFDILATLNHAAQLEADFGVGPHTVSFPRMEPAPGADLTHRPPHLVDDDHFTRIVAVLRLALPYTGLILSTRENEALRTRLIEVGVSQMSAASSTSPGGYAEAEEARMHNTGDENATGTQSCQFNTGDHRSLDDVVLDIVENHGYLPSWCTACYRAGRTGDHFMDLAKSGGIQRLCHPNSLLTFQEYLLDHAGEATRAAGDALIRKEVEAMPEQRRITVSRLLERIRNGERDLYI